MRVGAFAHLFSHGLVENLKRHAEVGTLRQRDPQGDYTTEPTDDYGLPPPYETETSVYTSDEQTTIYSPPDASTSGPATQNSSTSVTMTSERTSYETTYTTVKGSTESESSSTEVDLTSSSSSPESTELPVTKDTTTVTGQITLTSIRTDSVILTPTYSSESSATESPVSGTDTTEFTFISVATSGSSVFFNDTAAPTIGSTSPAYSTTSVAGTQVTETSLGSSSQSTTEYLPSGSGTSSSVSPTTTEDSSSGFSSDLSSLSKTSFGNVTITSAAATSASEDMSPAFTITRTRNSTVFISVITTGALPSTSLGSTDSSALPVTEEASSTHNATSFSSPSIGITTSFVVSSEALNGTFISPTPSLTSESIIQTQSSATRTLEPTEATVSGENSTVSISQSSTEDQTTSPTVVSSITLWPSAPAPHSSLSTSVNFNETFSATVVPTNRTGSTGYPDSTVPSFSTSSSLSDNITVIGSTTSSLVGSGNWTYTVATSSTIASSNIESSMVSSAPFATTSITSSGLLSSTVTPYPTNATISSSIFTGNITSQVLSSTEVSPLSSTSSTSGEAVSPTSKTDTVIFQNTTSTKSLGESTASVSVTTGSESGYPPFPYPSNSTSFSEPVPKTTATVTSFTITEISSQSSLSVPIIPSSRSSGEFSSNEYNSTTASWPYTNLTSTTVEAKPSVTTLWPTSQPAPFTNVSSASSYNSTQTAVTLWPTEITSSSRIVSATWMGTVTKTKVISSTANTTTSLQTPTNPPFPTSLNFTIPEPSLSSSSRFSTGISKSVTLANSTVYSVTSEALTYTATSSLEPGQPSGYTSTPAPYPTWSNSSTLWPTAASSGTVANTTLLPTSFNTSVFTVSTDLSSTPVNTTVPKPTFWNATSTFLTGTYTSSSPVSSLPPFTDPFNSTVLSSSSPSWSNFSSPISATGQTPSYTVPVANTTSPEGSGYPPFPTRNATSVGESSSMPTAVPPSTISSSWLSGAGTSTTSVSGTSVFPSSPAWTNSTTGFTQSTAMPGSVVTSSMLSSIVTIITSAVSNTTNTENVNSTLIQTSSESLTFMPITSTPGSLSTSVPRPTSNSTYSTLSLSGSDVTASYNSTIYSWKSKTSPCHTTSATAITTSGEPSPCITSIIFDATQSVICTVSSEGKSTVTNCQTLSPSGTPLETESWAMSESNATATSSSKCKATGTTNRKSSVQITNNSTVMSGSTGWKLSAGPTTLRTSITNDAANALSVNVLPYPTPGGTRMPDNDGLFGSPNLPWSGESPVHRHQNTTQPDDGIKHWPEAKWWEGLSISVQKLKNLWAKQGRHANSEQGNRLINAD
ncbi:hypothetical protein HJFPF1_04904 [Paramyrothecium foliicola]|nr:hypothetical protein HJFPF1_04904 [Paramyrothecium foliicola]